MEILIAKLLINQIKLRAPEFIINTEDWLDSEKYIIEDPQKLFENVLIYENQDMFLLQWAIDASEVYSLSDKTIILSARERLLQSSIFTKIILKIRKLLS